MKVKTVLFPCQNISWISSRYSNGGRAKVYIDDILQQEVDLYSSGSWQAQQAVFTKTGLSSGAHTIRIEVSGKAPWSSDSYVPVDAFDGR